MSTQHRRRPLCTSEARVERNVAFTFERPESFPTATQAVAVAHETRRSPFLSLGISPRGELSWRNLARAAALAAGRSYVLPDDLKALALPALAHRLVLANQLDSTGRARDEAERIVTEVLGSDIVEVSAVAASPTHHPVEEKAV